MICLGAEDMIVVIIKWSGRQHTGFTQAQSLDYQATTLGYVLEIPLAGFLSLEDSRLPHNYDISSELSG